MVFALKLSGRFVAQARMHARRVVATLDVGEHSVGRRGPCGEVLAMGFLYLQRMPIAFHRCIVIAVSYPTHRLPHGAAGEPSTHFMTGILTAAIRMEDESRRRL